MFLNNLQRLIWMGYIQAGTAFNQQKQLVRIFEDSEKRPQTVRNFNDRPGCMPWAVFLF